jgi:hypothetical protein
MFLEALYKMAAPLLVNCEYRASSLNCTHKLQREPHKSLRHNMSSLIDRLPKELHHNILSKLDSETLQSCRLVYRKWTDIGNEYFLPAVYFSEPMDLRRYLAIAQHGCIAGHVRSITFNKDIFGKGQRKHRTENERSALRPLSVHQDTNLEDGGTNNTRMGMYETYFYGHGTACVA